jgi:hypothetical protein
MTYDSANLSIDFLVGFTIFILAFIWVATMIPGILIGLQSSSIDYDAVAYRSGVLLVEDPGMPVAPEWDSYVRTTKYNISRFGLTFDKNNPNILSQDKIDWFFSPPNDCSNERYYPTQSSRDACTSTPPIIYPDDYHTRIIFGDYPYQFNISLVDTERNITESVGDILPEDYGYIRRLVKIKGLSNATLDGTYIESHQLTNRETISPNVTNHEFSILINNTELAVPEEKRALAYQIDPSRERIIINITDLNSTTNQDNVAITLNNITIYTPNNDPSNPGLNFQTTFRNPLIDGNPVACTPPCPVTNDISLILDPRTFYIMQASYSQIYFNLSFTLNKGSTFLNNTNARAPSFDYNYNPANVTQPQLRDAIVEVAVW